MMAFSSTQYQSAIDRIKESLPRIDQGMNEVRTKAVASANAWYMPPGLGEITMELLTEFEKAVNWIVEQVTYWLEGALAPINFWDNAYQWESVRGKATGVAGEVTVGVLGSTKEWTGASATAYTQSIAPQSAAAARLGAVADKTATALEYCAVAGLAFYVTLGIIIVEQACVDVVATAAACTGVGTVPALVAAIADAGVTTASIFAAGSAFLALLGTQASQMAAIHGEASDVTAYPGGHWPVATSA